MLIICNGVPILLSLNCSTWDLTTRPMTQIELEEISDRTFHVVRETWRYTTHPELTTTTIRTRIDPDTDVLILIDWRRRLTSSLPFILLTLEHYYNIYIFLQISFLLFLLVAVLLVLPLPRRVYIAVRLEVSVLSPYSNSNASSSL